MIDKNASSSRTYSVALLLNGFSMYITNVAALDETEAALRGAHLYPSFPPKAKPLNCLACYARELGGVRHRQTRAEHDLRPMLSILFESRSHNTVRSNPKKEHRAPFELANFWAISSQN